MTITITSWRDVMMRVMLIHYKLSNTNWHEFARINFTQKSQFFCPAEIKEMFFADDNPIQDCFILWIKVYFFEASWKRALSSSNLLTLGNAQTSLALRSLTRCFHKVFRQIKTRHLQIMNAITLEHSFLWISVLSVWLIKSVFMKHLENHTKKIPLKQWYLL